MIKSRTIRQNVPYHLIDQYIIQKLLVEHLKTLFYSYRTCSYIWYTKIQRKNSKRPTLLYGL